MEIHTFIADSAADAVAQIRTRLGPEAVVVNVRQIPGEGLARLWNRSRIEVRAYVPELARGGIANDPISELKQELAELKLKIQARPAFEPAAPRAPGPDQRNGMSRPAAPGKYFGWEVGMLLENSGVLPAHVERIVSVLAGRHPEGVPPELPKQVELASSVLSHAWRPMDQAWRSNVHVFIGPPGTGKTTCLCKWLANAVLVRGDAARVWRLDGRTANTAEMLSVYAEILGTPLERLQPANFTAADDLVLVDLPGVAWTEPAAIAELGGQIRRLPAAEVHLVLNAAYEASALLEQARAFGSLSVSSVIMTHLDEERRWGKLWNLVLGTNYTVSYLSAGQNVPGEFQVATPQKILYRQFTRKQEFQEGRISQSC